MSRWDQLIFILRHLDEVPAPYLIGALMVLSAILSLLIFAYE